MKFKVDIQSSASATVEVEIPNEKLEELARDLETTVENLAEQDLIDYIYEHMDTPSLCAQCAGWGRTWGLDLGDEWEIVEGDEKYPSIRKSE